MNGRNYKRYLITLLLVIFAFNYVDRLALGLLLQDIKIELQLSDTQLGFLSGFGFALFYSVMGIPIARWADRGNRVTIIAGTLALWSATVALCGIAGSYVQLLIIRVGAAIGEAGCIPPAHSLIADNFSRSERPRAVARYMLGVPLSFVIGFLVTGWLNEIFGWRLTFVFLGLPGIGLSILAWLTLREPRLDGRTNGSDEISDNRGIPKPLPSIEPSLREVFTVLWLNRTFRHLLLCLSVASFFTYGILQWKAAFFVRSFSVKTGELGTWFAAIYGVFGVLGTYLGGELASRYAANNERLQLKGLSIAYCSFGLISACIYLSENQYVALGFMVLATLGGNAVNGPLFATIQTLVQPRMRAMSVAIIYLFANLIGMGLGPLAAGALSDAFRPWWGEESLRYALLVLCPGYLWAGWYSYQASMTVNDDLAAGRADSDLTEDATVLR